MKIKRIDTKPQVDPYHADTGQLQTLTLWIDPADGTVIVKGTYGDNSTSFALWNGIELETSIEGYPLETEMRMWLKNHEDEIDHVCAGHSVKWDGNNMRGRLTDEAGNVWDALSHELENAWWNNEYEAWSVSDWLQQDQRLDELGNKTVEEVKVLAKEIKEDKENNIIILGDVEEYLLELREAQRD